MVLLLSFAPVLASAESLIRFKGPPELVEVAERESETPPSAETVVEYLGERPAPMTFSLSFKASSAPWTRAPLGPGAPRLGFDHFGNSGPHELTHVVTDALSGRFALEINGWRGRPPKGCNDQAGASWLRCVQEELVLAVTLRALLAEAGWEPYEKTLKGYLRAYPHLPALMTALERYEAERGRYPRLEDYFPELMAAFREAVGAPEAGLPAKWHSDRGVRAFQRGDNVAALEEFRKAVAIDGLDAESHLNCGVAAQALKRTAEAKACYDRAVELAEAAGKHALAESARLSRETLLQEAR